MSRDSPYLIVFDLGSSGGRAYLGWLEKGRLHSEELHRFSNGPVRIGDDWYWDILRIYDEALVGLRRAGARIGSAPALIGVDSYGVDYAYIDRSGALLSPMRHMRDPRTDGVYDAIHALMPRAELYRRTGAMTITINTLAQLFAERKTQPWLQDSAETLLFTPDLITYFLTGERVSDLTIASTSQIVDPLARAWRARRAGPPRPARSFPRAPGRAGPGDRARSGAPCSGKQGSGRRRGSWRSPATTPPRRSRRRRSSRAGRRRSSASAPGRFSGGRRTSPIFPKRRSPPTTPTNAASAGASPITRS